MSRSTEILADIGNEFLAVSALHNTLNTMKLPKVKREQLTNLANDKTVFVAKLIALACKQDQKLSQSIYMALYTNETFRQGVQ